jgi:hypothetical protein
MSSAHEETKADEESEEYKAGAEVLYPTKKKVRRSPKTTPRKTKVKTKTKAKAKKRK